MVLHFHTTGENRKQLVKVMADSLKLKPKYLGMPSMAYHIGDCIVSRDGTVTWEDSADNDPEHQKQTTIMIDVCVAAGFEPEEWKNIRKEKGTEEILENKPETELMPDQSSLEKYSEDEFELVEKQPNEPDSSISPTLVFPREQFSDDQLDNLKKLIRAKASLLKESIGVSELPIIVTDDTVSFPWFHSELDADSCAAYTALITAICQMAKKAKRITAKEREVENIKYAFRCFLLRLGFIGDEYKQSRKILMKNLTGSSAFKSGAKKGGEQG